MIDTLIHLEFQEEKEEENRRGRVILGPLLALFQPSAKWTYIVVQEVPIPTLDISETGINVHGWKVPQLSTDDRRASFHQRHNEKNFKFNEKEQNSSCSQGLVGVQFSFQLQASVGATHVLGCFLAGKAAERDMKSKTRSFHDVKPIRRCGIDVTDLERGAAQCDSAAYGRFSGLQPRTEQPCSTSLLSWDRALALERSWALQLADSLSGWLNKLVNAFGCSLRSWNHPNDSGVSIPVWVDQVRSAFCGKSACFERHHAGIKVERLETSDQN